MANDKRGKKSLDREEFGYGFDIGVDDLDVVGKNNNAKKQPGTEAKEKQKIESSIAKQNK